MKRKENTYSPPFFIISSLHSSISHLGVLVAPQIPMVFTPWSHAMSISLALSMRWLLALTRQHSLKRTLPLLLLCPQTKRMRSWREAKAAMFGMRLAT